MRRISGSECETRRSFSGGSATCAESVNLGKCESRHGEPLRAVQATKMA